VCYKITIARKKSELWDKKLQLSFYFLHSELLILFPFLYFKNSHLIQSVLHCFFVFIWEMYNQFLCVIVFFFQCISTVFIHIKVIGSKSTLDNLLSLYRLGRIAGNVHKNIISIYEVGKNKPYKRMHGDLVRCFIFIFCSDFDWCLLGAMPNICCVAFFTFTFTFMHLADAFIQSDLQYFQVIHFFVSMCSLGIEPTTFALLKLMLYQFYVF